MNKVVKRFENMMLGSLVMSLIDVAVGLLFILYTDFTTKMNMIIVGSFIILHGLFYLVRYFYDGLGNKFFSFELIFGVAAVILGVFTVFNPMDALKTIGVLFGIWLCISAIDKLYYGIKFITAHEEIFPLVTFLAILLLIMGVLTIFNPFKAFTLITRLIGLFMIASGLFDAVTWMLFRRRAKQLMKLFN